MSTYVDALMFFGNPKAPRCFRNKQSCHLFADTTDELHAIASKIGLKRSWFQISQAGVPHYDLTPVKRQLALTAGAISLGRVESVRKWKEIRAVLDAPPLAGL